MTNKYQTKTIEGQLNQLLSSIEYLQDKLAQARKNGWIHDTIYYKAAATTAIYAYQDLRATLIR